MMSFLFLPSSLICTLHELFPIRKKKKKSFFTNLKKRKGRRLINNSHLLSGTISWSPLNHFTSPPASSNSQTSVNVSFSTSCCDFNTFTNLYGYSAQRKRTKFFFLFQVIGSRRILIFEKNFFFFSHDRNAPTTVRTVSVLSVCLLILQMYSPLSSRVALFMVKRQTPFISFDMLYVSPS